MHSHKSYTLIYHTDRNIYNGSWDEAPLSYSSSLSSAGNLSLRFHSHSERDCHIGDFLALSTVDDDDDDDSDDDDDMMTMRIQLQLCGVAVGQTDT
jgi:hypothetical protein